MKTTDKSLYYELGINATNYCYYYGFLEMYLKCDSNMTFHNNHNTNESRVDRSDDKKITTLMF